MKTVLTGISIYDTGNEGIILMLDPIAYSTTLKCSTWKKARNLFQTGFFSLYIAVTSGLSVLPVYEALESNESRGKDLKQN